MINYLFKTKARFIITLISLTSFSVVFIYSMDILKISGLFKTFLLIISMLLFCYIFFFKNFKYLGKNIKMICDADTNSTLRKTIFRYALIGNIGVFTFFFLLLKQLINTSSNTTQSFILGVECTVLFPFVFWFASYTTSKKFVCHFRPKSQMNKAEDDIKILFSNEAQYLLFIDSLKKNSYHERFKTDMLFRAAVIRKANERSLFKKIYLIKELKKTIKGGKDYLDKPAQLKIYTDEDLGFIDDVM